MLLWSDGPICKLPSVKFHVCIYTSICGNDVITRHWSVMPNYLVNLCRELIEMLKFCLNKSCFFNNGEWWILLGGSVYHTLTKLVCHNVADVLDTMVPNKRTTLIGLHANLMLL